MTGHDDPNCPDCIIVVLRGVSPAVLDGSAREQVGSGCYTTCSPQTWTTLTRYFQSHFQTYGRHVKLIGYDAATTGAALAADMAKLHAFAVMGSDPGGEDTRNDVVPELARQGIEYFTAFRPGYARNSPFAGDMFQARGYYRDDALDGDASSGGAVATGVPYFWSFEPSAEDIMANGAAWLCRSIIPARHARHQRIALGYDDSFSNDHQTSKDLSDRFALMVTDACGYVLDNVGPLWDSEVSTSPYLSSDPAVSSRAVNTMSSNGDTSVVCLFCSYSFPDTFAQAELAHSPTPFLPEFMLIAGNAADPFWAREHNQSTFNGSFGLSTHWALPGYTATHWYQAYSSVGTTSLISQEYGFGIYEELMQLFGAIQLAGPDLTPEHVANGDAGNTHGSGSVGLYGWQRRFDPHNPIDPPSPAAGYTPPSGDRPTGHHAFLRGMIEEQWDSSGVAPPPHYAFPGTSPTGCYRMIDPDERFDVLGGHGLSPWPLRDDSIHPSQCTGDEHGGEF